MSGLAMRWAGCTTPAHDAWHIARALIFTLCVFLRTITFSHAVPYGIPLASRLGMARGHSANLRACSHQYDRPEAGERGLSSCALFRRF